MGWVSHVIYMSTVGKLVRWDSHKHPRDKNGRFTKISGSSYLYGKNEQARFSMPGASPGSGGGPGIPVTLSPGDRVYGTSTGSKIVQHADGTGTMYISGSGRAKVTLNSRGVQGILQNKALRANLEQAVPGQIVKANSEHEASVALGLGTKQDVSHDKAPKGKISVDVPDGSSVHKTTQGVVVHHKDNTATVHNAATGTSFHVDKADTVLPNLRGRKSTVSHPHDSSGEGIKIDRKPGDVVYKVDDGVVIKHSVDNGGGGTFHPIGNGEAKEIESGKVNAFINEHGGVISGGKHYANEEDAQPKSVGKTQTKVGKHTQESVDAKKAADKVSDKSTQRSPDAGSEALRRARAGAINKGKLPTDSKYQDEVLKHPTQGDIQVMIEPGSKIHAVDKGFIVTYTDGSKPAILFKKDAHSLTGMTKREIDGLEVTAQVNSDGSVEDFRDHHTYGGIDHRKSDPTKPDLPQTKDNVPESEVIEVDTEQERENFLKLFAQQDIKELNGIPVELLIQVRKKDK